MYEVVLMENKVKVKTLFTYARYGDAKNRLDRIENEVAFLPKKSVYKDKKLIRVYYEVLLIKKREKNEKNKKHKVKITINDDDWIVLDHIDYHMEELYNVTGANRKLSGKEVLDHILLNPNFDKKSKQVLIMNNRVIISGTEVFMVTCKDPVEAMRLYNKLRIHCFDNKIGGIIFFGTVDKDNRKYWYRKIHRKTGIKYNRLYRSKTR